MSKHLIFLVHGMGQHDQGWSADTVTVLRESFAKALPGHGSFDDFYDIKELQYSDQFDGYWERYDGNAATLRQIPVIQGAGGLAGEIAEYAARNPDDSFLRTHVGDILLYAGTAYNHSVPLALNVQILNALQAGNYQSYSIVAHSMGTRVCHDLLQRTFTGEGAYQLIAKPKLFMNCANVTRLMSFDEDEFGDGMVVYPKESETEGVCTYYVNAYHKLDPVAMIRRHKPKFKSDPLYREIYLKETDVTDKNVHDLSHYLLHPDVHSVLFNLTLADYPGQHPRVSDDEVATLVQGYRATTKHAELKAKLDKIKDEGWTTYAGVRDMIEKIAKFFSFIRD